MTITLQVQLPVVPQLAPEAFKQTKPEQQGDCCEQAWPAPGQVELTQLPAVLPGKIEQVKPEQQSDAAVHGPVSGEHWGGALQVNG